MSETDELIAALRAALDDMWDHIASTEVILLADATLELAQQNHELLNHRPGDG